MAKYYRPIKNNVGKKATFPLKNKKDINLIMNCLIRRIELSETEIKKKQARRNWMVVLLGFNTAFRAEDLLQLKVRDVDRGFYSIKENKTGKTQNFPMNKFLYDDLKNYIKSNELLKTDYLFATQKKIRTITND